MHSAVFSSLPVTKNRDPLPTPKPVTHSAGFSSSPVTEDRDPQPTSKPTESSSSPVKSGSQLSSQAATCPVDSSSAPEPAKHFTQPAPETGATVSLFQFMENVAIKIPSKWKRVGVAFGLNQSQIDAIEKHRLADAIECFSDVFKYWQETSTHKHPANWASLISVLRSNYVGEERLAEYIQETFM